MASSKTKLTKLINEWLWEINFTQFTKTCAHLDVEVLEYLLYIIKLEPDRNTRKAEIQEHITLKRTKI